MSNAKARKKDIMIGKEKVRDRPFKKEKMRRVLPKPGLGNGKVSLRAEAVLCAADREEKRYEHLVWRL